MMAETKPTDALTELDAVFDECADPNWDGRGAAPVACATYGRAREFIEALPPEVPVPDIGAEPDGCITVEWYSQTKCLLSISIGPSGERLLFAGVLLNDASFYGTAKVRGLSKFSPATKEV